MNVDNWSGKQWFFAVAVVFSILLFIGIQCDEMRELKLENESYKSSQETRREMDNMMANCLAQHSSKYCMENVFSIKGLTE